MIVPYPVVIIENTDRAPLISQSLFWRGENLNLVANAESQELFKTNV